MKNLNETMKLFVEHKPEFLDILGFESCSYNDANETYSCVFNPSSSLTHSNGTIVQGGFVAGMLDSAMAQFILNLHEFKINPLSLDIDVKYLLPCKPARLVVNAKILKMGKSIAFTSAELYQEDNLVATATATNKLLTIG
ncbi:MAG: PaaI family thioesterase [SAR86 cluster bacterium]|jgi:acyl-coenzyme A thioesterase PaaI-like protein|nr:PaaI family thioesterase [SAR86 cluster bacterium]MDG1722383.1 PaaI family thioesterase [SAR86 cluster bacterium]|tara:strand:+ start:3175 stop:3594 length:420 start_codon:yes stop_codon:yes gene_type:complete